VERQVKEKGVTGVDLLREFGFGDLNNELANKLSRVIELIREDAMNRGKGCTSKGAITLKINLAGECLSGAAVTMAVDYDIGVREPKPVRTKEVYFVKGDRLVRENPTQERLNFERELERGT
jgi:hypothetical protein